MGRSRRSSIVSEPKTLVFESLFWNVVYKVMTNEHVIEAFKRPIVHVYKANDNMVLNSLLHSRFLCRGEERCVTTLKTAV